MSSTDLFGNLIPDSKASKKFTLQLTPQATHNDKKQKTKIYAIAKNIIILKKELIEDNGRIHLTKKLYSDLMEDCILNIENQYIDLIDKLHVYLIHEESIKPWQKELLFHCIQHHINNYQNFHLNTDRIKDIIDQIKIYLNKEDINKQSNINTVFEPISIEAEDLIENHSLHNAQNHQEIESYQKAKLKFKKIYKVLIKQIHPDILSYSSEEHDKQIQDLTEIWDNKDYYKLLELNHKIDPNSEIELTTEDLSLILKQLKEKENLIKNDLEILHKSTHFTFFINSFYNTSNTVITSKIKQHKKNLLKQSSNNNQLLNHNYNSLTNLKTYLNTNRKAIAKALGITFIIEDLYGIMP